MPWWLVGLLVVAAVPRGWWLGRALDTGGYRLDDEWPDGAAPTGGAAAGSSPAIWRWAAALALPGLWGLLAWRLGHWRRSRGCRRTSLAWLAVALTWTDPDTHRLPEGLTLPAIPGLLALLPDSGRNRRRLVRAGTRGALRRRGLRSVLRALVGQPGGFGMGDVTLAGLVALRAGLPGLA